MFCEDAFCVPVCLLIILYVLVVSLWMSRLFQAVLACALFTLSVILLLISGFDLILVCYLRLWEHAGGFGVRQGARQHGVVMAVSLWLCLGWSF